MIEIVDSFEANSASDVKSIAEELGVVFPPDFANFLLIHNGGTLFHTAIFLENEWWGIAVLEPIQHSNPGFWGIRIAQDEVPEALKPAIVFGQGGDSGLDICLSCNGNGTVFFWHGHLEEVIETELSFAQFIEQLKVNPESDYWTGVRNGGAWGAAESGDWEQVESLVPVDINEVNQTMAHPQTILATAAACGRLLVVKNLLALGADPNTPGSYGQNAIHCAVGIAESSEILAALVEAGGDIDAKDEEGRTPLMLCALGDCRPQVFQWLVSNGADASIKTDGLGDVRRILNRKKDRRHSPISWKCQLRALDAAAS